LIYTRASIKVRQQQDYKSLVKTLEERFAPPNQTELYRVQLTERRQKPAESLPELGQAIIILVNLAYPTIPSFVLSDTLPAVLSAVVVRKYERPSVTLRSALLKVSNSTASRIASFKFWGRIRKVRMLDVVVEEQDHLGAK
jgi:hypothetical protein